MRRVLFAVLLLCMASSGQSAANKTDVSPDAPRFQLIQAKAQMANRAGSTTAFDDLFLLDTKTGKVWRWAERYEQKDATGTLIVPQHFDPVFVDGLEGKIADRVTWVPAQSQTPAPTK